MLRSILVFVLLIGCGEGAREVAPSSHYPYTRCPVTDRGLDEFHQRRAVEYGGRELQTCCRHCARRVLDDPARYFRQLDEGSLR